MSHLDFVSFLYELRFQKNSTLLSGFTACRFSLEIFLKLNGSHAAERIMILMCSIELT